MSGGYDSAVVDVLKTYFAAMHESSEAKFHQMWHPRGILLGIGPSGLAYLGQVSPEAYQASPARNEQKRKREQQ